ncbi:MAG TPA: hypothetical protein VM598_13180, partial [Bdellovibrionota bacterium]|nr:hypothetical protein [Bdellovibrionota bacterium]
KGGESKPKKPIEIKPEENGEVPTITSLLGRKKLRKKVEPQPDPTAGDVSKSTGHATATHPSISSGSKSNDLWATRGIVRDHGHSEFRSPLAPDAGDSPDAEADKAPSKPKKSIQLVLEEEPKPVRSAPTTSTVHASRRAKREEAKPPITWTAEMLRKGSDPLGKGLSCLLDRGATHALFLAIAPPAPGGKLPQFVSAASTQISRDRIALWTGLKWDPSSAPAVWSQILKGGYIELPPPGAVTNIGSGRNTIRAAFGMSRDEILLLIRVGPVSACRGVLAVFSEKSLIMDLTPILTLFNTPLPQGKAA